jgi:hypothetical protein
VYQSRLQVTVEKQVLEVPSERMQGAFRTTLKTRELEQVLTRLRSAGMIVTPKMRTSHDDPDSLYGDIIFSFDL